jgi:hypothetical protein
VISATLHGSTLSATPAEGNAPALPEADDRGADLKQDGAPKGIGASTGALTMTTHFPNIVS